MIQISSIRASIEEAEIDEKALAFLGEVAVRTSLRYALQLLTPAKILATAAGRAAISKADIAECDSLLFMDAKASAKLLTEMEKDYLQ